MLDVEFDWTRLERKVAELTGGAYRLKTVTALLATLLHRKVEDKFDKQGPGWKRLSPITTRIKKSSKVLTDTGRLAASLTPHNTLDTAEVFTNVVYAKHHLNGTRNMPKRDFLNIDIEKTLSEFEVIVLSAITKGGR